MITLIVAMDLEGGIGKNGGLPWHLSTDLRRFKQITMGSAIVMGRKTYQSIGKPLPGRKNIVITGNPDFDEPGVMLARNLVEGLKSAQMDGGQQIFVIGGAQIFEQTLPLAQKIHLTVVHTRAGCQVFFPPINWINWRVDHQEFVPAGARDEFSSTYYVLSKNE